MNVNFTEHFHIEYADLDVSVNYTADLSPADSQRLFSLYGDVEDVLGAQTNIPKNVDLALGQISAIWIVDDHELLGELGRGNMRLSMDYVRGCSQEWLASIIAHEGQHQLNTGKFQGANLWQDEESACTTQLALAKLIKMSDWEQAYLVKWMDPSNKAAMQAHMQGGFHTLPAP
jgi:hypothetical protein